MNIITGMISPDTNCAPNEASEQLVVLLGEGPLDLTLTAEHLDQVVAGERLLDVRVEPAGAPPLLDEHAPATAS